MAEYLEAKLRLFANQGPGDFAVINGSDPAVAEARIPGAGRRVDFAEHVGEFEFALPGPHNAENAAAAACAARALGIADDPIRGALLSFSGVPHRLERVAEVGGVAYVNDSKATNVAAAGAALRSFDGGVHAILGGSLKGGGFAELAEPVAERCRAAYLIGQAAAELDRDLEPAWRAGVEHHRCAGLAEAVRAAAAAARAGEVVLLAPACASFDAYPDFEARGEHFRGPGHGPDLTHRAGMISRLGREHRLDGPQDRALAAADGDALPARDRGRDGLQRQLDHLPAG